MWRLILASKDLIIPLASGVVGAFVGGWATVLFQRKTERKRFAEKILFDVYMMLLELKGHHFWIISAEIRGKDSDPRVVRQFQDKRWRVADEMRKIDHLPEAREILRVMFSLTYKSERERANELDRLLHVLGKKLNRQYDQVMAEITRENQALMVRDLDEFFIRQNKIQP